ncbi:amino acid oxidase [Mycobacterium intermedium]|uniref:D-amino-acid oxidase n=1 Tax=Mycobacterium intermedium TaxID=28445 RepID=A0A1E3S6Z9_MYCIE|nr:FAD-dependent oxidoreductase [Mycobacterium intermedium]MCV6963027.1 FAD-binding oxidoreductase [Mycobacterium intermedium]ODQ97943.1 amino acid oxidase [Mycobacterium intermedium]OPE49478.1 amino acid oxidase [Mycobacterium intermedium]ORA96535.1 amino acid oxidase [Mycobacterium intermedium]
MHPIVVIGAGVSGLTSAVCLAEEGWPVRVWTATLPSQTTSVVAGAVWRPRALEPVDKTLAWGQESLREFRELVHDPTSGVRMAPALSVYDPADDLPESRGDELVPDLRPADPAELPSGFRAGAHATLPMIDMLQYLDYLTRRLAAAGCDIEIHPARSLAEAAEVAPVVVNCAGLGARELASDKTIRPAFGQHVVLANPGLTQLFVELTSRREWTCYFPHPNRVVCGGISIPGRWDTGPIPEVSERILRDCYRVEPRLTQAAVIETITGLRPDRPVVRVERENIGSARCIHNYGHGGDGVTLSWGCAREVVRLVSADR